ncbi:MAG: type IV toxin-antitoxin system AbiEi family antitoxin domain-containing protein, partial [Acidobacteria bacterium]|nr:type IV toxin-antitoxin system AbiEi family antitoxin domain-containing protein [Acidobacteriota bacterium]
MFHNAKRLLPNEVVLDVGKQRIRSCAVAMYSNHGQVGLAARNVVVGARDDSGTTRRGARSRDLPSGRHALRRLRNLSPHKLQPLLQTCQRVKVKRL